MPREELAQMLDVGMSSIFPYEREGRVPRADVLGRMAQVFDVSADYLLGLTDEPGAYSDSELTVRERTVIEAMRHGDVVSAIKTIVADE